MIRERSIQSASLLKREHWSLTSNGLRNNRLPHDGFFRRFPSVSRTSTTGSTAERLNARYQAIIAGNEELLRDKRILDIASH
jgi:hypothetical protein